MIELDYRLLFGDDKQLHLAFFLLSSIAVGLIVLFVTPLAYGKRNLSYVWFTLVSIGLIEEYRQFYLPNRSAEFLDALTNMIGATVGIVFLQVILSLIPHLNKSNSSEIIKILIVLLIVPSFIGLWFINQEPFIDINFTMPINLTDFISFRKFQLVN